MRKLGEHVDLPDTSRANPVKWQSTNNKRKHIARHTARRQMPWLMCKDIGLVCGNTGLFCDDTGLFGGDIDTTGRLMPYRALLRRCRALLRRHRIPLGDSYHGVWFMRGDTGLLCGNIGLFCGNIVHFCGDTGLFCGDVGYYWKNDAMAYVLCVEILGSYAEL